MGFLSAHFLLTLTLFASGLRPAAPYSKSAPCVSLLTMRPSSVYHGHPVDPETTPPPYTLKVLDETGQDVHSYQPNKVYTIRLSGKTPFRGFLIQPRMSSQAGQIIGHFRIGQFQSEPDWETRGIQFQTCATANQDSITHIGNKYKYQVVAKWSSEQTDNSVQFAATIVVNQTYFWAQWAPPSAFLTPIGGSDNSTGVSATAVKPVEKTEGADLPSSLAATTSSAVDGTSLAATTSSAVDGTTLAATTSAADGTSVAGTTSAAEGTSAAGTTSAVDGTSAAGTTSAGSEASTSAIGTSVESTGAVKKVKPTVESSTVEISAITSDKPAETTKVEATSETPAITSTESASGSLAEGTTAGSAATSTARHSKTGGNRTGGGKGPKQGRPQDQLETTKKPKRPAGGPELPIGGILPDQIGTDFNPFSAAAGGAAGRRPPPGPIVILRPQKPNEVEGPVNNGELCTSNPCRNNGTCYTDPESEYTCVCTKGWAGKECADRDNCISSPCKNGAVCINEADTNGFKCECQIGWSGAVCDRVCPSYICKNGGTCKIDATGDYGCTCPPGWTGKNCEAEIDECASSPCLHGGTCKDKLNGFTCTCQKGYTGDHCHRPCLNIYKSCERWREEDRCESMRHLTKFFDVNCAITCNTCEADNSTMHVDYPPYPPTLESFHWLIGRWLSNSTYASHFPVDFDTGAEGYSHVLSVLVNEVPMFGTPSLNYTLWAVNNRRPDDIQAIEGFLTLKRSPEANKTAALLTSSNNGVNMIEEGAVIQEKKYMELKAVYNATLGYMKYKIPQSSIRIFSLDGDKLTVKVKKTDWYGKQKEFALTYTRTLPRKLY